MNVPSDDFHVSLEESYNRKLEELETCEPTQSSISGAQNIFNNVYNLLLAIGTITLILL